MLLSPRCICVFLLLHIIIPSLCQPIQTQLWFVISVEYLDRSFQSSPPPLYPNASKSNAFHYYRKKSTNHYKFSIRTRDCPPRPLTATPSSSVHCSMVWLTEFGAPPPRIPPLDVGRQLRRTTGWQRPSRGVSMGESSRLTDVFILRMNWTYVFYCGVWNVLFSSVLYSIMHCWIALNCTVLHGVVLYCIVMYFTELYCIALHRIAMECVVLYCTVLYIFLHALHCIWLYFTAMHLDWTVFVIFLSWHILSFIFVSCVLFHAMLYHLLWCVMFWYVE